MEALTDPEIQRTRQFYGPDPDKPSRWLEVKCCKENVLLLISSKASGRSPALKPANRTRAKGPSIRVDGLQGAILYCNAVGDCLESRFVGLVNNWTDRPWIGGEDIGQVEFGDGLITLTLRDRDRTKVRF